MKKKKKTVDRYTISIVQCVKSVMIDWYSAARGRYKMH